MSEILKQKLFRITEIIHLRMFGHEMSGEMRKFLGNLNYTFAATIFVGIFIYALNIIAGRWLSIEDYGYYQLVLSISFFLIIPITMGLTTAGIHALAKRDRPQGEIVSSMLMLILFFGGISTPVMLFFSRRIAWIIGTKENLIIIAILYTIFFSAYSISKAVLQGLLDFRRMALFEIIYASVAFGAISILIIFGWRDFRLPLFALSFGFTAFLVVSMPILYRFFRPMLFSRKIAAGLMRDGMIMVAASISGFLLGNIDRFIINGLISIEAVALYSAYVYSSGIFLNFFLQTFITVFFPSMANIDDAKKLIINEKINRLYLFLSLPLCGLSFIFLMISLSLFGNKYGINYEYVFLFSIYVIVQFFVSTKQWLLASFGKRGMLYSTYATVLAATMNVAIVYLFTRYYGLGGAISGLIISLILFIFINRFFLGLLCKK